MPEANRSRRLCTCARKDEAGCTIRFNEELRRSERRLELDVDALVPYDELLDMYRAFVQTIRSGMSGQLDHRKLQLRCEIISLSTITMKDVYARLYGHGSLLFINVPRNLHLFGKICQDVGVFGADRPFEDTILVLCRR